MVKVIRDTGSFIFYLNEVTQQNFPKKERLMMSHGIYSGSFVPIKMR